MGRDGEEETLGESGRFEILGVLHYAAFDVLVKYPTVGWEDWSLRTSASFPPSILGAATWRLPMGRGKSSASWGQSRLYPARFGYRDGAFPLATYVDDVVCYL